MENGVGNPFHVTLSNVTFDVPSTNLNITFETPTAKADPKFSPDTVSSGVAGAEMVAKTRTAPVPVPCESQPFTPTLLRNSIPEPIRMLAFWSQLLAGSPKKAALEVPPKTVVCVPLGANAPGAPVEVSKYPFTSVSVPAVSNPAVLAPWK